MSLSTYRAKRDFERTAEPRGRQALPRSVASGRDLQAIAADPDHVWTSRATQTRAGQATGKSRAGRGAKSPAGLSPDAVAKRPGIVRAALPDFVEPQLATLVGEAPEGDAWLHEVKLDGYRILARLEGGHARLFSRRGNDWTSRLPSVASALAQLRVQSGWLDGELVVLAKNGVSDFQTLQNSLEAGRDVACTYFVFDLPFLAGFDLRRVPLLERKALLGELLAGAEQERLRLSQHLRGAGPALFERAAALGLEGIVSKRADAPYTSGRGRAWLKVKCISRQEFVIGGYTEPVGARGHLGALLLGVREGERLTYAGKVGAGFTRASLEQLAARLAPLEQSEPPFSNPPRGAERRGVHWVRPGLVAEVAFSERTQGGLIRHGSFQGLREDKAHEEVRLEAPSAPPVITIDPARLEVTHPDRILFPEQGITKRELMIYYARVARWMLPHVVERPLMLVRCPEGADADCFHQKHPSRGMPRAVEQVTIAGQKKPEASLVIRDVEGLIGLVQMGTLEIHTWGSRVSRVEYPDQLVFDLDPDEGLPWVRVVEASHALEALLRARG
ncbi:MAG TPA: DNA ligase D, partial [Polyangiaceae bacterium]|nr:DNA ligase D [Polyangiaceae bacterium]